MADNQAQKRLLEILAQLFSGRKLTAAAVAEQYGVSVRTAQRDLDQLQALRVNGEQAMVTRSSARPAVYQAHSVARVAPGIVLMLEKMILDSRGLEPIELQLMLQAAVSMAPTEDVDCLNAAVHEELLNYQPIVSHQPRAQMIWTFQKAIEARRSLTLEYSDHAAQYPPTVEQFAGVPLAISFSKQYFRLTVYVTQAATPEAEGQVRNLHMDWITSYKPTMATADALPQAEIGERRRVDAYGYRGERTTISFEYYGLIEYVQDQYATARVVKMLDKPNDYQFPVALVEMDVDYSPGVRMWLITQSPILRVLSPQWVVDDVKAHLHQALARYEEE